jgi:hypothetical protein
MRKGRRFLGVIDSMRQLKTLGVRFESDADLTRHVIQIFDLYSIPESREIAPFAMRGKLVLDFTGVKPVEIATMLRIIRSFYNINVKKIKDKPYLWQVEWVYE